MILSNGNVLHPIGIARVLIVLRILYSTLPLSKIYMWFLCFDHCCEFPYTAKSCRKYADYPLKYTHTAEGYYIGIEATIRTPQYQWRHFEGWDLNRQFPNHNIPVIKPGHVHNSAIEKCIWQLKYISYQTTRTNLSNQNTFYHIFQKYIVAKFSHDSRIKIMSIYCICHTLTVMLAFNWLVQVTSSARTWSSLRMQIC